MKLRLGNMVITAVAIGTLFACSDDAELADPGGMGAGRPDTAASAEAPAESVLQYSRPSPITDTSAIVRDPPGPTDSTGGAGDTGG